MKIIFIGLISVIALSACHNSAIENNMPSSSSSAISYSSSSVSSVDSNQEDLKRRISPSPTIGMKTYRNDQYGFELDYPLDWRIAEYEDQVRFDTRKLDSSEYILITKPKENSFEDISQQIGKEYISKVSPFELSGEKGTTFESNEFGVRQHILIEHVGLLYHFITGSRSYERFLSNFRFIERISPYPTPFAPRFEGDPNTMFNDPR
ncbi:MAG: PsbP-related protein [Candidatus Peregrinibacteria bacterium]